MFCIGPRLVAFLQSRSKAPLPTDPVPQTGSSSLADSSVQSNWLHMNVDESEKTQWMKDVKIDPNKMPEVESMSYYYYPLILSIVLS